MIGQQVDLVDVEDAAMGGGQQAGLKGSPPFAEARSKSSEPRTRSSVAPSGRSTNGTRRSAAGRSTSPLQCGQDPAPATRDRSGTGSPRTTRSRRQQRRQGPRGGALGRPLLARDQYPADPRIDGVEQESTS